MSRPGVVLLHGTRMDARAWAGYAERLPGVPVVTPELPGHGARAGQPFTEESVLAVVSEGMTEARARADGRRPVLVGHSLGGYVAMLWARHHPDALGALGLVGATGDPSGRLVSLYRAFGGLVERSDPERLASRTNGVMRRLGASADSLSGPEGYAALPDAWRLVIDRCGPHLLADLGCPILLVNGQLDQMRLHVRRYANAASRAGAVRVVTVPRATHLLPLTHPDAVAAEIRRLIDVARP